MKTVHRPCLVIAVFFSSGIILQQWLPQIFEMIVGITVVCLLINFGFSRRQKTVTVLLLIAAAGAGFMAAHARAETGRNDIARVARYYRGKSVTVEGQIASAVETRNAVFGEKRVFRLDINKVLAPWGWQAKTGQLLVNCFHASDLRYGDRVRIEGKLHRPFNFSGDRNFSYRDYLEHRGIRYLLSVRKDARVDVTDRSRGHPLKSSALRIRRRLIGVITDHLTPNEAGIIKAVILGDRSRIIKPVRELFVRTGTAHILAISGLHIGIVAGLFWIGMKLFPVSRSLQLMGVIVLLTAYSVLTGGRPSVIRATVMTTVFLLSLIVEKEPDAFNTMSLAALIILLINPFYLFDAGFQLSFICVFSILMFNERFGAAPSGRNRVIRSLAVSLAIWTGAAGLIAYYFGIVTPVTILANLLVIPLIAVIVTLGFGLLGIGILVPQYAFVFSGCLKVALNGLIGTIFLCDKLPLAHFYVRNVTIWYVVVYYTLLTVLMLLPWSRLLSLSNYPAIIDKSARL